MLKAAVIGVGSMGQNHARVYREMDGVQLVGVTDANPTNAAKIGNRLNVPFYTDIEKLLTEQKPDLVSISVPTSLHFNVGMDMINRGLHVLIEKPITSTIEQAE
jgi:predicted dehydrogenase